jgi:outer membrane lipopolysaccharide assembly protein LptE/RlpB
MRMGIHHLSRLVVLLAVSAALGGCGYSLAGRGSFLPDYIRTIGVPQFTNSTTVYDVDRKVSEQVRGELAGRGKYKIEPKDTGVDAVLTGDVNSITITPVSFNQQQQATRYVLTLSASVQFKDVKTGKVLWANPAMAFREEFEPTTGANVTDVTAFFGQDVNALERIASEFARAVVSALLEAF